MNKTLDRLVANKVDPAQAQAMAEEAAQAQAPAQQASQKEAPPSAQEAASKAGSPETEGDKANKEAILYKVMMGEEEREFTPEQISSAMSRYSDLNYRNQQMKPVTTIVENIMKANPNTTPEQIAQGMLNLARQANKPQQGGNDAENRAAHAQAEPDGSMSNLSMEALEEWEKENAATLPPAYKNLIQSQAQTSKQLQQMTQLLQQVIAGSQGVAQAAQMGAQNATQQTMQAQMETIGNNIDRTQQALQIPDKAVDDFKIYFTERGYVIEDFIDPNLTQRVMSDFKNQLQSPEMEQMRQIHQRRQAYTGGIGSSPSAGDGAPTPQGDSTLDRITSKVMNRRTG